MRNRVFFLFDSQTSLPSYNINIKSTPPGGAEVVTRVLVKPLERKEIPIHKLGTRALLGDLERRQSWIHIGPNRPLRGSAEEENIVRREGESLGCKWSLVSKWTSFYAVEEPYEAGENVPDSFLDIDDVYVHEADRDLDLLRPRGASGERVDGAMPALQNRAAVELDDESEEGDDDDDNPSDSEGTERDNDSGSDSDDEGDDDNPRGGGTASGNGNSGGEVQQRSDPGEDSREGDEQGNKEGPTGSGPNEASSAGGAQSLAAGLPMHEVTYEDPQTQAPPTRYPLGTQLGATPYPSTTDKPRSLLDMKPKYVSKKIPSITKRWTPDMFSSRYDRKDKLFGSSYDRKDKLSGSSYDRKDKPRKGRDMSPPPPTSTRFFNAETIAPSFNLPASGALISGQKSAVKTDEEREGEDLVANLLIFQKFDGAFRFSDQNQVESLLGDDFGFAIKDLALKPEFQGVDMGLITSIAIVVFLELKFRFCEDLWVLMVDKARAYVDGKLSEESIFTLKETLYELTELQLVDVKIATSKSKTQTEAQPETLPPTETEQPALLMSMTSPAPRKRSHSRSRSRERLTPSPESGERTPTLPQETTTGENPSVPVGASSKGTPWRLPEKRRLKREKVDSMSQLAHAPTATVAGRVRLESAPFDD